MRLCLLLLKFFAGSNSVLVAQDISEYERSPVRRESRVCERFWLLQGETEVQG